MCADDDIERNITSSDVEFLEGDDSKEKSNAKKTRKVNSKDSADVSFNNTRHVLTTSDLSGASLIHDGDVDMNIMSVHDQMIDKELTLSHVARWSPQTHSSIPQQSSERKSTILNQGMLKHNRYPVLMFSSSSTNLKKARLGLSLNDSDSSFGNNTGPDENR
jgi:hypothetical protein